MKKSEQQIQQTTFDILNQFGYLYCKDVVSKEMYEYLTHVMLRKHSFSGFYSDGQIDGIMAHIDHNEFLETVHEQIWPKLELILGEELYPTYTYARLYTTGNYMTKHTDRPACEVSVTVQLGRSHNYSWPIYMAGKPYYLNEGDGLIYKGCDIPHWRDICTGPEGYYSGQVFFHFVRANGDYVCERGDLKSRYPEAEEWPSQEEVIRLGKKIKLSPKADAEYNKLYQKYRANTMVSK
jgi:hypothetical protein